MDEFDENFLEDKNKNKSVKDNEYFNNEDIRSNKKIDEFILRLNDDHFSYCFQELKSYNICKNKLCGFEKNNTKNNLYIKILKKECENEIFLVYNCLKRYGIYI